MGYSGFKEYLCVRGHYAARDVYDDDLEKCPNCGEAFSHYHGVDQTNGYDESEPYSCRAPKKEIGFDDKWHVDHHGNRYATKIPRFRPLSEWREIAPTDGATGVATKPEGLDEVGEQGTAKP